MPAADPLCWEIYLTNATDVDGDGFQLAQADWYGEAGGEHIETMFPYGMYGRALDPVVDQRGAIHTGCPMLVAFEGGKAIGFPMTDKRAVAKVPKLQKGESLFYGPLANFVRCHADGAVRIFTTSDGQTTGQAIHNSTTTMNFERSAPWGRELFDATGYHLRTHSGARLDMGGIGGMPAPLDALGNYAVLSAAMVKLQASIVVLGPDTGLHDPVVLMTKMVAYCVGLETLIETTITALGVTGGGLLTAANAAAALAAFTTGLAGLAPLKAELGSTSVTAT